MCFSHVHLKGDAATEQGYGQDGGLSPYFTPAFILGDRGTWRASTTPHPLTQRISDSKLHRWKDASLWLISQGQRARLVPPGRLGILVKKTLCQVEINKT